MARPTARWLLAPLRIVSLLRLFLGVTEWPTLRREAFHGLAGRVVQTIRPDTEADDIALLLPFLGAFGVYVGRKIHAYADGARHPARINGVLAGRTGRSRKGSAQAHVEGVFRRAAPGWVDDHVRGGLASGEGFIYAVRDEKRNAKDELVDEGVQDKRLLVVEPEFARVLAVAVREGNTLSELIREAWDDRRLESMTRRDPLRATNAHVSIFGHITLDELRLKLTSIDAGSGFANRFLFALVQRSEKLLPSGGNPNENELMAS